MRRRNCAFVFFLWLGFCLPVCIYGQQRSAASASHDSAFSPASALIMSCGMDQLLGELRKDPKFIAEEKKKNDQIFHAFGTGTSTDSIVLPVVVHIVNNNPSAITDQVITAAIADLNDAYAKRGAYSASPGADTRIRFGLAKKDPNGGITTGINRVVSFFTDNMNMYNEDSRVKNLHVWDPVRYINIWVVTNIKGEISADFGCGIWTRMNAGGYATMPTTATAGFFGDGIVVTGFGSLLAHEMGHYLGLYHTFEGGCTNNNCLTDGDKVCDTPPDGTTRGSSCTNPTNSCTTDTLSNYSNGFFRRDTTDQVANFMDYNNTCSYQFTEGQAERMRAAIAALRPGLLPDVLVKPCSDNVTASFTRDKSYPVVGDNITFTNKSTGATVYRWLVNDVSIATGPDMTKVIPASGVGKVKVTLYAYLNDVNSNCYASFSDYVIVNCGVTARFYNDKKTIASKAGILLDTIRFVNGSVGAATYEWYMSNSNGAGNNLVSSNAAGGAAGDLNYAFGTPGVYYVKMIAGNGGCRDTAQPVQITVIDPTADVYINMTAVNCYQETKVRAQFYFCNSGYVTVRAGLPITFYEGDPRTGTARKLDTTFLTPDSLFGFCCSRIYTVILDVGKRGLNQLWAVINDAGTAIPVALPNASLVEKIYSNNISVYNDFKFRVSATPVTSTLEPGDTLAITATGFPDPISYAWNTGAGLSCTTCRTPFLYADTNIVKRVIASSTYGCADTAYVTILVPPADDYTIAVNSVSCVSRQDSIYVDFTINNGFRRGKIPKDLSVSFYKGNPSAAGALLLASPFVVPATISSKTQSYRYKIKKITGETLYASVNDNGAAVPVVSASAAMTEKLYTNNITGFSYTPIATIVDTTICTGNSYAGYSASGVYTDQLVSQGGCDSVRVLRLTVRAAAVTRTTVNASICTGQAYYGHTVTGTFTDVFKGVNACDSIRTLNLVVNPVVNKSYTIDICAGQSYSAAGRQQTQTGVYKDTVQSYLGCDSVTVTNLFVHQLPVNFLPADTSVCIGKTLTLDLTSFTNINWNTGSTNASLIVIDAGIYSAHVTDRYGCQGDDSINITFGKCIPVQIPSAFTPNHDGKNDVFRPVMSGLIRGYKLEIFNRWGELLFTTSNASEGWNGQYKGESQPVGTYVFFLSFTDGDGFSVMRKGSFVLLK